MFFFFWPSTRTYLLHASAIKDDENRNFQHLIQTDRGQLQLSRRRWLDGYTASFVRSCPPFFGASCHTQEQRRYELWRSHGPTVAHPLQCTDSHRNRHIVASCEFDSRPNHNHKTTTVGTFHTYLLGGWHQGPRRACMRCQSQWMLTKCASLVLSVKTPSGQDDLSLTITRPTDHRRRGYLPICHLHSAFFSDRVRGVRTCSDPCNAFLQRSNMWIQHLPLPTSDQRAPVIQCGALYKIGEEHKHSYIRKMRKKRSDEYDVHHV